MAGDRTLKLKVLGDAKGAVGALDSVGGAAKSLAKTLGITGAAVAGAMSAVGVFAYKAIQQASDLNETQSKVGVIFGGATDAVRQFASTAAGSLGQSKQSALDAAATFGIFGKSAGLSGQALADFSINFTKLASDLASFNNTSPEMAIQAIGAALRGESEPLRRYGVLLNDAAMRQKAMELGIYQGNGALTSQQKILSAQALIYEQTADAQGDFARTSDGLANQQRILKASIQNLTTSLGSILLPYFQKAINALNKYLTPAVEAFTKTIDGGGTFGDAIKAAVASMGDFGLKVLDTIENISLATLNFIHDFAVMVETISAGTGIIAALFGNVDLALKSAGAVVAAGMIRNSTNKMIESMPGKFDAWRNSIIGVQNAQIGLNRVMYGSADAAERWLSATGSVTPEIDNLNLSAGGASKTIKTAAEKLKDYTDALKAVQGASRGAANASEDVRVAQADLVLATNKVSEAQKVFNLVTKGYAADSKEGLRAIRETEAAQKRLRNANLAQEDAIRGVAEAEANLARLRNRQADVVAIADAERDLERSKYGVEEANFRVADAEKQLADLRNDPDASATDIRRAEINLAEAKLAVFDSVQSVADAEKDLATFRNFAASPDEIADAERELERAKNAVADATDEQRFALEELTAAQENQNQVLNGAVEGSDAYKKALEDLSDAKANEVEASKRVREAQEKEIESAWALVDAKKALAEIQGQTPVGIQTAAETDLANRTTLPGTGGTQGTPSTSATRNRMLEELDGFRFFASGGIVRRPTLGVVGEAGPEAVLPLSALGAIGNTNVYVTINAGLGTDPAVVGDEIVNILTRYQRRNGSLPLKVS